jgi:hypothetical protein
MGTTSYPAQVANSGLSWSRVDMFYVSLPSRPLPTSANSQSLAEASPQLSSAIFKHFVMNYLMSPDGLQIMDNLHNSTHWPFQMMDWTWSATRTDRSAASPRRHPPGKIRMDEHLNIRQSPKKQ